MLYVIKYSAGESHTAESILMENDKKKNEKFPK